MPMYKVEANHEWFIVFTDNKAKARSEGVREWGRGSLFEVTRATRDDVRYFKNLKGETATNPSL